MSLPRTVSGNNKKTKRSAESKKLVFLSNKVLEEVMHQSETNGTNIANRILEIYKDKKINMDFKNVQRRVYDALNVLSALNIIDKGRGQIKFRGSPYVSGGGIDVFGAHITKNTHLHENNEIQAQKRLKEEKIKQIEQQINLRMKEIEKEKQLLKEQVLQHISIKKIIKRNFENNKKQENEKSDKNV